MEAFLITLFYENPWLLYVLLGIIFVLLILVIFGVIQGREVSIYPPKIGSKIRESERADKPTRQSSNIQSQQQTQNVNIFPSLTHEQIEDVAARVAEKVIAIRKEANYRLPKFFYQPPELSNSLKFIFSVQLEIEKKVRNLVLSRGGAWAGHSLAGIDIYLKYARNENAISKELEAEIRDFFMYTRPAIQFDGIPEENLKDIQYLAAHINKQLDAIPLGPLPL